MKTKVDQKVMLEQLHDYIQAKAGYDGSKPRQVTDVEIATGQALAYTEGLVLWMRERNNEFLGRFAPPEAQEDD